MDATHKKVADFLGLLRERTIDPIHNSEIKEYCTATLLLIFSAIDAISKITCDDSLYSQGVKARFKNYLTQNMSAKYKDFRDEIYLLRCDIVHSGIGTKIVLSKDPLDARHLEKVNNALWINTRRFLTDFEESVIRVKENISNEGNYFRYAANRLEQLVLIELDELHEQPMPSAGPKDKVFPIR